MYIIHILLITTKYAKLKLKYTEHDMYDKKNTSLLFNLEGVGFVQ